MKLYVIDTVTKEQTDFVFKYLKETFKTKGGLAKAPKRYIGFRQDYTYVPLAGARILYCYSDNPPSHKDWLGYKSISVDELFELISYFDDHSEANITE